MIQVSNLSKFYGEKRAISGLNFKLEKGEIVGLLGLNGAGKTTTIRILTGYLIPSAGDASIDGKSIFDYPLEAKQKIGYLPETPPLYEDMTISEYLQFVGRIKKIEESKLPLEIEKVIEKTNLGHVKDKLIGTLSLGYRKRVGIAQAILGDPEIVIMDEPISGLDPKQIVEIRSLIRSLAGNHTVLISSHILTEIYKTCDKFLFLHKGTLKQELSLTRLEEEMNRLAGWEVGLSGKPKDELISFMKSVLSDADTVSEMGTGKEEELFMVHTTNPKQFKESLFSKALSLGIQIESLKKQEVSLEQIFMEKI
ncbi:ABC transporter ATP-binding protein [Leptospira levettii]|uniref:ABC transporter ATP-binding protein n=1 Tax=Leptospira levettii TaxID=2023178 RepID=UPI00108361AD|nr:ABC transporter ATP-binding protein [Leptospira levettii]MCG6147743.1 ABC transporter ATP-binding protein [Leptospira levettii]TGK98759.1 ABC transporter ATP-binding protein [Leptospira levettii]TGM36305.1 ABC transporter ATP-binding protein [Leptospira levettii]TGM69664.1 ABC transporter ATP-binding protein [Leptospira levettii]TGM76505.1 ABC transporter ATP-binding protein [Leptospira levettii]